MIGVQIKLASGAESLTPTWPFALSEPNWARRRKEASKWLDWMLTFSLPIHSQSLDAFIISKYGNNTWNIAGTELEATCVLVATIPREGFGGVLSELKSHSILWRHRTKLTLPYVTVVMVVFENVSDAGNDYLRQWGNTHCSIRYDDIHGRLMLFVMLLWIFQVNLCIDAIGEKAHFDLSGRSKTLAGTFPNIDRFHATFILPTQYWYPLVQQYVSRPRILQRSPVKDFISCRIKKSLDSDPLTHARFKINSYQIDN